MPRRLPLGVIASLITTLASAAPPVPIEISVLNVERKPIPNVYVALYAPEDRGEQPTREMIAAEGRALLSAPPGVYTLFAAVNGHQPSFHRFTVGKESPGVIAIQLQPYLLATGTVSNSAGNPVAAASIRHAGLPLSEMAMGHLAAQRQTKSDANGSWTLSVPGQFAMPLLIEATGRAPAWVVSPSGGVMAPIDVALAEGGRLTAELDRTEPELSLALESIGPNPIPQQEQTHVWRRDATTTVVEWNALAPGEYRIIAFARDPRRYLGASVVGQVQIQPGTTMNALVTLPVLPPLRTSIVRLFVDGQEPSDLDDLRVWAGVERAAAAVERTTLGTVVYVDTTVAPADIALTTTDALITANLVLDESRRERPLSVLKRRRAQATLTIVPASDDVPVPRIGSVTYRDCDRNTRLTLPVAVLADGTVSLNVPADCRSLTLALPPLETLILRFALKPRETKSLGTHKLSAAARAIVHVRRDPSGAPVPSATVRALAIVATSDRTTPVAEALADTDGVAALDGLPTDTPLVLEARATGGTATGSMRVQLEPGQELIVEPLNIPEPATIIVEPHLPATFRERWPGSKVAAVVLQRQGNGDAVHKSQTERIDASGLATFREIEPGTWQLSAVVEAAGTAQPIDVDDFELAPGESRRVAPEIEPLVFEGLVVSTQQHRHWSVGVGDPPSPRSIRRRVQSDRDGRFAVVLGRTGFYDVSVVARDRPDVRIEIGEIEFSDPSSPIEIVVPEGSLAITVRDGSDPLGNATVTATLRRDSSAGGVTDAVRRGTTNASGKIVFDAVPPGRWIARAAHGDRTAAKLAEVRKDTATDVQLQVGPTNTLEGVVRNADGRPAAHADVGCLWLASTGPTLGAAEAASDGHFTLDLGSEKPATLHCTVTTIEGAIGAWNLSPGMQASFTLPVPGGSLVIPDWGDRISRNDRWLRSIDGRLINLSWVAAQIGRGLGEPLVIPHFPPGTWILLRADSLAAWTDLARGGAGSLKVLAEVRLEGDGQRYQLFVSPDSERSVFED